VDWLRLRVRLAAGLGSALIFLKLAFNEAAPLLAQGGQWIANNVAGLSEPGN